MCVFKVVLLNCENEPALNGKVLGNRKINESSQIASDLHIGGEMLAVLLNDEVADVCHEHDTACNYLRQFLLINGVQVDFRVPFLDMLFADSERCDNRLRATE